MTMNWIVNFKWNDEAHPFFSFANIFQYLEFDENILKKNWMFTPLLK